MEEPVGSQYAVQIALQTLKERCKKLQERMSILEEENSRLKGQLSQTENRSISMSDLDKLKSQVTELSESKLQLLNKIKMVTGENQELWSKLSRLSQVNHSLGSQLNKINDSLVQYSSRKETHTPLIRSKTFTQDEPHTKVLQKNIEENGRISSELEEISLKILESLTQEKNALKSLSIEIHDMQWGDPVVTDSCGFVCDDYDNNVVDDFSIVLDKFKDARKCAFQQKIFLGQILEKLTLLKENNVRKVCDKATIVKHDMIDKSTSLGEITEPTKDLKSQTNVEASLQVDLNEVDMICPICCRNFAGCPSFDVFQEHVEQHFTEEPFELL